MWILRYFRSAGSDACTCLLWICGAGDKVASFNSNVNNSRIPAQCPFPTEKESDLPRREMRKWKMFHFRQLFLHCSEIELLIVPSTWPLPCVIFTFTCFSLSAADVERSMTIRVKYSFSATLRMTMGSCTVKLCHRTCLYISLMRWTHKAIHSKLHLLL